MVVSVVGVGNVYKIEPSLEATPKGKKGRRGKDRGGRRGVILVFDKVEVTTHEGREGGING